MIPVTIFRSFSRPKAQRLRSGRETSVRNQFCPQRNAIGCVHRHHSDSGTPTLGPADDDWPINTEMERPALPARMEQANNLSGERIDPGKIRSLVIVVMVTGQREVVWIVRASVLSRDYVLDVEVVEGLVVLVQPAVFAPMARSVPDQLDLGGVHQARSRSFKILRALA